MLQPAESSIQRLLLSTCAVQYLDPCGNDQDWLHVRSSGANVNWGYSVRRFHDQGYRPGEFALFQIVILLIIGKVLYMPMEP